MRKKHRARPGCRSASPCWPRARSRKKLLECLAGTFDHATNVPMLGGAVEMPGSRLLMVTLLRSSLPREAGSEADQARPRAVRQPELALRDFHAA